MRSPAEVLDAAADRIERDGWYRGDFFADPPPFFNVDDIARILIATPKPCCVSGALIAETGYYETSFDSAAETLLMQHLGLRWIDELPRWNDAPGRTKEEVVAALRAAAAKERGQ